MIETGLNNKLARKDSNWYARNGATFNANGVFAAMFILALVALITETLITSLENRLIRWRPNTVSEVTI